jgi:hypothetical protein
MAGGRHKIQRGKTHITHTRTTGCTVRLIALLTKATHDGTGLAEGAAGADHGAGKADEPVLADLGEESGVLLVELHDFEEKSGNEGARVLESHETAVEAGGARDGARSARNDLVNGARGFLGHVDDE